MSIVMTASPEDVTYQAINYQTTAGSGFSLSSTRTLGFYFECAIIIISILGTVANALILYALVASKQHKKNVLIFSMNGLDCFTCVFVVITYILKLCNIPLIGEPGRWFCLLLLSENIVWCGVLGSKFNLVLVTIERYLKVVHPAWSKKHLSNWMMYWGAAFSWIAGFLLSMGITLTTTDVVDGVCYSYVFWPTKADQLEDQGGGSVEVQGGSFERSSWISRKTKADQLAYAFWYFIFFIFVIPLIFAYCYGRILMVIRRQASVMAGHNAGGSSTSQTQSQRVQSSIIKTMILVSALYIVSSLPMHIFYLILNITSQLTILGWSYYTSLFISFLYFCTNPFIYASKFNPVKKILLGMIPWKKTTAVQQSSEGT